MDYRVISNIKELIGNTPLLRMDGISPYEDVVIYGKLEYMNPGGSVKDRIGVAMIEDAIASGLLKAGGTIVEATAGNTGIGVALAAVGKGIRVICVVPSKFSVEKQQVMRAYGAEVINTPKELGMKGAIEEQNRLLNEIPNSISLQQFMNPVNPQIHYETTGREIYEALEGKVDYLIGGAGSGGTFSGIMRYLKEQNPNIKGVLADPIGSTIGGGEPGCYDIEGIGNTFIPGTMDVDMMDKVFKIKDEDAVAQTKRLAREFGVFVGTSSGAGICAAIDLAEEIHRSRQELGSNEKKDPEVIVVILADKGDRYLSKNIFA